MVVSTWAAPIVASKWAGPLRPFASAKASQAVPMPQPGQSVFPFRARAARVGGSILPSICRQAVHSPPEKAS